MTDSFRHPIAVMGLPIDSLTADQAVAALERLIASGGTHQVCPVKTHTCLTALADPYLQRIISASSLILHDGMPLLCASRLMGCPLAGHVAAVDLISRLAELSARKGYKIFLLGARPGVAERAGRLLQQKFPGVRIVGTFAPAEDSLIRMDHSEMLRQIHSASPDILLVALGNTKQEKWIWMHRKRLGVPLAMGVGDSFDILVGDRRRAPRWVQRCGLEWAMRFLEEPVRLGPRYLRDFAGLARWLPMAVLAAWCQKPFRGQSRVTTAATPDVLLVNVQGRLGTEIADAIDDATTTSIINGLVMVVDLQAVQQVTAAGFGVLLAARRQLLEAGLSISLAGLSLKTRFALKAWGIQSLFNEWQSATSRNPPAIAEAKSPVQAALYGDRGVVRAETRIRG